MPSFRHRASFENATVVSATALAVLVELEDREKPIWIPQSQIDDDSEIWREGDAGLLITSEWIATEKGLI